MRVQWYNYCMYSIEKLKRLEKYKYSKDTLEKMRKYVSDCKQNPEKHPTLERMCLESGVLPEVVRGWGEKYIDIMDLLATLETLQRDYLQRHPSQGNIFLLKSIYDMQDTKKTEITITKRIDNRPLDVIAGELVRELQGKPRKTLSSLEERVDSTTDQ